MNYAVVFILLCELTLCTALSEVRQTPEDVTISHVANAISAYGKLSGHMATTWEEVGQIIILEDENKWVKRLYGYRIQDRYQFITQPMALPADADLTLRDSQVLFIRTVPLTYKRGDTGSVSMRRRLLYKDKEGNILRADIPEETAKAMLAKAGVQLITPPGAPAVENDEPPPVANDDGPAQLDLRVNPKAPATNPSPASITDVKQIVTTADKQKLATWPWVAGVAALALAALFAWKRRS